MELLDVSLMAVSERLDSEDGLDSFEYMYDYIQYIVISYLTCDNIFLQQ